MEDQEFKPDCPVCFRLGKTKLGVSSFPMEEIEETVKGGCPTCRVIWEGVNRIVKVSGYENPLKRITIDSIDEEKSVAAISCWEELDHRPRMPDSIVVEFFRFKGRRLEWDIGEMHSTNAWQSRYTSTGAMDQASIHNTSPS